MNTKTSNLPAALNDLAQAFEHEAKGQPNTQLTRDAITDGSVLIDPRNLACGYYLRVLVRNGMLTRFGSRSEGVQYYQITNKGFDALFMSR
jgi:hypothetical protein